MKVTLISDAGEVQRVFEASSAEQFVDYVCANVQVVHELGDPIIVDAQGNDSLMTVYNDDGTVTIDGIQDSDSPIKSIAGGLGDLKDFDGNGRGSRKFVLEEMFNDVFLAAIQSGLLIDKATKKACEAMDGIEQIEAARNRVVTAQLDKEFGVD